MPCRNTPVTAENQKCHQNQNLTDDHLQWLGCYVQRIFAYRMVSVDFSLSMSYNSKKYRIKGPVVQRLTLLVEVVRIKYVFFINWITLTWVYFCVFYRGSAQPVGMDGITVTPTSPARSTQKTSAASSMTVATSYRGCTYGSTSSCDGQRRPVYLSTYQPTYLPPASHTPPRSVSQSPPPLPPTSPNNWANERATDRLPSPPSLIQLLLLPVTRFQKKTEHRLFFFI